MPYYTMIRAHKKSGPQSFPSRSVFRTFAGVGLLPNRRLPGQIVIEIHTSLAVESLRVVNALAAAVHHLRHGIHAGQGQAARRVAVARAPAGHHHLVDGVVVLLLKTAGAHGLERRGS